MQRGQFGDHCPDCNAQGCPHTVGASPCDWHRSTWMTTEEVALAAEAMRRQERYEMRLIADPVHAMMAASRGAAREFYETILEQRGL